MKCRRTWGCAALLALALALSPRAFGAAPETSVAQPSMEVFSLGFSRIAEQLQNGRELDVLLAVSPGYLPVPDRDAANALRQMLVGARFGYRQRSLGEESGQSLRIWAAGQPALTLTHRSDGNRRIWTSPQLVPEGVETPLDLNLFGELLSQTGLGEAVFPAPAVSAESNAQQLLPLQRLLGAAGESDFVLTPEVANRALDVWRLDPAYGALLRPLISGWRVVEQAQISYQMDEGGELASFRASAHLADPGGQVWNLDCKGSRALEKRQYVYRLDATLSRSKSNIFNLSATVTVTEQAKDQLRQTFKLTCEGKLNGNSVDLRMNGNASNRFSVEGDVLTEQIDGSYTLDWKAREPSLANLGLDEWKVTLGVKGTLRTSEAYIAPASTASSVLPTSFDGKLSLAMTRSRRDFLSADAGFSVGTADYDPDEEPQAALVWERLGKEEQEQLEDWRALMRRQLAGKLMMGLDEETQNGILLQ